MITPDGYRILQQFIQPGMNVLELGDQLCDWSSKVHGQRADIVLKDLHQVDVTTIDIHGNNRALPLNLNEYPCCGDDMHGSFDLVTDFGTMEHTDDIFNCLSNVYLSSSQAASRSMPILQSRTPITVTIISPKGSGKSIAN